MPARWQIDFWPECTKHAFLSHCAEDRANLVSPVFEELERRKIAGWFDRHHYPAGRDSFETLREELLGTRHVVYFITPAMLNQGRGWTQIERGYSATIQQLLRYEDIELAHVELPLLFADSTDDVFQRLVYRSLIDKSLRCNIPILDAADGYWGRNHVEWAADAIESFVHQEEQWAINLAVRFAQDSHLQERFATDDNRRRRILAESPPPFPGI
ncbi:MAG: toll/interleukin-1 receptor domain-containing protein [Planctomycetia bacterium]|nr:toll/interleukin-1 receptor domain-containing protein [Planctomycetia bacterium]